jgi:uncharacterized protein (TIGR02246 family)
LNNSNLARAAVHAQRRLGALLLLLCAWGALPAGAAVTAALEPAALLEKVTALDTELFAAYNSCDMDKFAELFAADVEFYHDTGGVTYSREAVVQNTKKYICGKVRRELVPHTLEAFPVKDFGAIVTGEHRFCELATGKCEGIARFVLVWRNRDGRWRLVRVLSFGHRTAP